ncbi:MAG: putative Zn-dependent protease, partial [Saprospiraceae bacterium]
NMKNGQGLNLFSIQDDIEMGRQFSAEIEKDQQNYPILPERGNEEAYKYIRGLTDKILNSGEVAYKNEFDWTVKIVKDDKTLNAFAVPGGYLYVYTGLIKYLDSEDQLAGVMGHEIAHAALRHSTQQMTKLYGLDALRAVVTGKEDGGTLSQMALSVISLGFSRKHESQADEYSVRYLCGTSYNAAGAAGFFEKLNEVGGQRPPEFLSTHPDPGNRVKAIHSKKEELNCKGNQTNVGMYNKIKKML